MIGLSELRTLVANRLFRGTRALEAISAAKWAIYPALVRRAPKLALMIHEPESSAAFWNAISRGMIVIDGGANMGGYSVLAANRVGPTGKVFAFEPEPRNFQKLVRKMRAFPNVTPVQKAIGGKNGVAFLNLDDFHAGHTLTSDRVLGTDQKISVPVTTIDAFVEERGLPGVDVIKLDVEGVEIDALAGMTKLMTSSRRPVIVCEIHPPILPEDFVKVVEPLGYRTTLLDAQFTGAAHAVPVHVVARPVERYER